MATSKNPEVTGGDNEKTIAVNQLRSIIERIERLAEEKASLAEDIAGVYGEAKGVGFDTKAIRTLVRLRKKDRDVLMAEKEIVDLYATALGMDFLL